MATKTEEKTDTKNIEKLLNSINKVSKKEVAVNVKRDNSAIKRIVKLHGEYCQMFQMTFLKAIMTFNLTKNDILVLFGYSALMEYGNALNISQQDVGKAEHSKNLFAIAASFYGAFLALLAYNHFHFTLPIILMLIYDVWMLVYVFSKKPKAGVGTKVLAVIFFLISVGLMGLMLYLIFWKPSA